jgi:hypothetical protein
MPPIKAVIDSYRLRRHFKENAMEIVIEKKVKIPVADLQNLLEIAVRGLKEEDPGIVVEMDAEELAFLDRLVTRGMLNHPEPLVKDWAKNEFEFFRKEIKDDSDKTTIITS